MKGFKVVLTVLTAATLIGVCVHTSTAAGAAGFGTPVDATAPHYGLDTPPSNPPLPVFVERNKPVGYTAHEFWQRGKLGEFLPGAGGMSGRGLSDAEMKPSFTAPGVHPAGAPQLGLDTPPF